MTPMFACLIVCTLSNREREVMMCSEFMYLAKVRGVGGDEGFRHFQGTVLLSCITGHQHWGVRGEPCLIRG